MGTNPKFSLCMQQNSIREISKGEKEEKTTSVTTRRKQGLLWVTEKKNREKREKHTWNKIRVVPLNTETDRWPTTKEVKESRLFWTEKDAASRTENLWVDFFDTHGERERERLFWAFGLGSVRLGHGKRLRGVNEGRESERDRGKEREKERSKCKSREKSESLAATAATSAPATVSFLRLLSLCFSLSPPREQNSPLIFIFIFIFQLSGWLESS